MVGEKLISTCRMSGCSENRQFERPRNYGTTSRAQTHRFASFSQIEKSLNLYLSIFTTHSNYEKHLRTLQSQSSRRSTERVQAEELRDRCRGPRTKGRYWGSDMGTGQDAEMVHFRICESSCKSNKKCINKHKQEWQVSLYDYARVPQHHVAVSQARSQELHVVGLGFVPDEHRLQTCLLCLPCLLREQTLAEKSQPVISINLSE